LASVRVYVGGNIGWSQDDMAQNAPVVGPKILNKNAVTTPDPELV
jgi:hypothetical protein